jgi:hypothetical protein
MILRKSKDTWIKHGSGGSFRALSPTWKTLGLKPSRFPITYTLSYFNEKSHNQNTTHGKLKVILVTQEHDFDLGCGFAQGSRTIKCLYDQYPIYSI